MNQHHLNGLMQEIAGQFERMLGKVLGNKTLETKGLVKNLVGQAEMVLGNVQIRVKKRPSTPF